MRTSRAGPVAAKLTFFWFGQRDAAHCSNWSLRHCWNTASCHASVLGLGRWFVVTHTPKECRSKLCAQNSKVLYNYVASSSTEHHWRWDASKQLESLDIFI